MDRLVALHAGVLAVPGRGALMPLIFVLLVLAAGASAPLFHW